MTHFPVLLENISVKPILAALEKNPDLWNSKEGRTESAQSPHREVPDIWVRYNDYKNLEKDREHFNDEHIPVWYEAWHRLPELRPIIFELIGLFNVEMLGGVLITKVPAGKKVYPHIDKGWHVDYYDKLYVQLAGAEGCEFCCEVDSVTERFTPKAGQVYLFDNRKNHWVDNKSAVDRITLIVCVRTEMFGRK